MKTLGPSLTLLLICSVISGCGPSHEETEMQLETDLPAAPAEIPLLDHENPISLYRYMPPTDPNLNPQWDWTVAGSGHTVYYTDVNGIVRSKTIQVPFYTSGHPLNTLEKDMYKEDGWVLAFRDFGTANAAPDVPFFVLYNKYRGILRIMLYNSRELSYSRFNLELSFKSTSATGALFTYTAPTRAFLDDYDASKVEVFMVEANSINGWIYGDFMLTGYDPNLSPSTQARLQVRGLNVSNLTLESTAFTLSEVLSQANPGSQSASSGGDLIAAANQGHKYFSTAEKAAKSLREKAEKDGGGTWWQKILQAVVGTTTRPKPLAAVAPMVGGLVGFITSFIGGADDPAPREPLNFEGSLKMSGTIVQSTPLLAIDFGLRYAPGSNPPDYYRVLNNITWGIFNLHTKPRIVFERKMICPTPNRSDCYIETKVYPRTNITYTFNTAAGMRLVSVLYAYTFAGQGPTRFMTTPTYTAYTYSDGNPPDPLPNGIAVQVKMRANSATLNFDDDIVYYKVHPFAMSM